MRDLVPLWGGRSNLLTRLPKEEAICLSVTWWLIVFSTYLITSVLRLLFSKKKEHSEGNMGLTLWLSLNEVAELMD